MQIFKSFYETVPLSAGCPCSIWEEALVADHQLVRLGRGMMMALLEK